MKRKLFSVVSVVSLLLFAATVVLWVMPSGYWPNRWWGKFIVHSDRHRALVVGFQRRYETPSVSPPQDNLPAFLPWIEARTCSSGFLGFKVTRVPMVDSSKMADGREHFMHLGTVWSVDVPFVAMGLFLALLPGLWLAVAWRRRMVVSRNRCTKCSYNLTGNTSGVCPECGSAIGVKTET